MSQLKITIHQDYNIDPENLAKPVQERAIEFVGQYPTSVIYLNPICTIVADEPSKAFFETVKKWQGKWCKQVSSTIGRSSRRRTRDYISDRGRMSKRVRFFERAFSFTGILFVDQKIVQPHRWSEFGCG